MLEKTRMIAVKPGNFLWCEDATKFRNDVGQLHRMKCELFKDDGTPSFAHFAGIVNQGKPIAEIGMFDRVYNKGNIDQDTYGEDFLKSNHEGSAYHRDDGFTCDVLEARVPGTIDAIAVLTCK